MDCETEPPDEPLMGCPSVTRCCSIKPGLNGIKLSNKSGEPYLCSLTLVETEPFEPEPRLPNNGEAEPTIERVRAPEDRVIVPRETIANGRGHGNSAHQVEAEAERGEEAMPMKNSKVKLIKPKDKEKEKQKVKLVIDTWTGTNWERETRLVLLLSRERLVIIHSNWYG